MSYKRFFVHILRTWISKRLFFRFLSNTFPALCVNLKDDSAQPFATSFDPYQVYLIDSSLNNKCWIQRYTFCYDSMKMGLQITEL